MKNIMYLSLLLIMFSCGKNDFYIYPSTVKLAKENNVFLKEFKTKNKVFLSINNKKHYVKEVFVSYKYNKQAKIAKDAIGLVFVFDESKSDNELLDLYPKFKLSINSIRYNFMIDSGLLVVPLNFQKEYFDFKSFNFIYQNNDSINVIEFIQK